MDGIRVWKAYGNDVLLLSSGFVLDRVMEAADLLREQGIMATVAEVNIINAKDPSKVIAQIKNAKKIDSGENT